MRKISKKGQIGNLNGIVLTLVIVGILIGVAYLVLANLKDNLRDTLTLTTYTVVNESVVPTTTGVYLKYNSTTANVYCYTNAVVKAVVNQSGAYPIVSENYTINPATGLFSNLSSATTIADYWNVTYTYDADSSGGCEGIDSTITATDTIPDFLPIIIIVAIVGILLAIVFGVLPKAGGGASGGRETAYV